MRRLVLVIVPILLAGCFATDSENRRAAVTASGDWVLTSGRDTLGEIPIPEGRRVTMSIEGDQIGGMSPCNAYGGKIELAGDSVRVADVISTLVGCEIRPGRNEDPFLETLIAATHWSRNDDELRMTGARAELRFALLPPVPFNAMKGRNWVLATVTKADATASSLAEARLVLGHDGTFTGSTGRRLIHGNYAERRSTIQFDVTRADAPCPDWLAAQDRAVVWVLAGSFAAVDGTTLTLSGRERIGLVYRAVSGTN
jgi:heat shock protein HslJ